MTLGVFVLIGAMYVVSVVAAFFAGYGLAALGLMQEYVEDHDDDLAIGPEDMEGWS